MKEADIILNVSEEKNFLKLNRNKTEWLILNKVDIKKNTKVASGNKVIFASAKTGKGLDEILNNIHKEILNKTKQLQKPTTIVANIRQAKELKEADFFISKALKEDSEEIIGEHLRQTCRCLERIIGSVDVEEVLGNIFSSFCIGK